MACGPTALAVPDQRMGAAFRVGCTLNKARGMRALGKVPCGVAGLLAPGRIPHGLGKHGGRPCYLEGELSRQIAQRRAVAADAAHATAHAHRRVKDGRAVGSGHGRTGRDRWKVGIIGQFASSAALVNTAVGIRAPLNPTA